MVLLMSEDRVMNDSISVKDLLGDYVDRGQNSRDNIEFLLEKSWKRLNRSFFLQEIMKDMAPSLSNRLISGKASLLMNPNTFRKYSASSLLRQLQKMESLRSMAFFPMWRT
jgi:hypothetical protein